MPIEEMARRGRDTLAFGPMRPVGLIDPRTGTRPFACVQLRQDDAEGRLYNMVGFQTKMTYPEQRRVFRMIPGLERAEFVRLGSLHRNTFVNSPALLLPSLQVGAPQAAASSPGRSSASRATSSRRPRVCSPGSTRRACCAASRSSVPPRTTALGSLLAYVTQRGRKDFQPMNANYGLFPPLGRPLRGREKKLALAERALDDARALARERQRAARAVRRRLPGSVAEGAGPAAARRARAAVIDVGSNSVLLLTSRPRGRRTGAAA